MPPHPPTKDVTTTETITDKDTTVRKVTRDHDELGQHTHTEETDRLTPRGHVHIVATDVEKDDGEHVHKEVVDKDGSHGEHIHEVVTQTDKPDRHVEKHVTDVDSVGDGHVHEEEKVSQNRTLLGDGTITRVVKDRDEPGHHHHEEVTTIQKDRESSNPSDIGNSVTRHIVDDTTQNGVKVHEVTDVVEARGAIEKRHSITTDKDSRGGAHVHTEKLETTKVEPGGEKHIVVDEKVVVEKAGETTVDKVHREATIKK